MKIHFTALEENSIKVLYRAIEGDHQVSQSSEKLIEGCEGLVVGLSTEQHDPLVAEANKLGVPVLSVTDLIRLLSEDKQRVVVAGSNHTSLIAEIMIHVLSAVGKEFDYALWSSNDSSFQVRLTDAPLIILEGSSQVNHFADQRPQFLVMAHHVVLITEMQDQFPDRYPSFDRFVREFDRLADATPKGGTLVYCEDDDLVTVIGGKERPDVKTVSYTAHKGSVSAGTTSLKTDNGALEVPVNSGEGLSIVGAALVLAKQLSITEDQFYEALKTYKTA